MTFQCDVGVALIGAAKLVTDYNPQLGKPRVDTLIGSKHADVKELRLDGDE